MKLEMTYLDCKFLEKLDEFWTPPLMYRIQRAWEQVLYWKSTSSNFILKQTFKQEMNLRAEPKRDPCSIGCTVGAVRYFLHHNSSQNQSCQFYLKPWYGRRIVMEWICSELMFLRGLGLCIGYSTCTFSAITLVKVSEIQFPLSFEAAVVRQYLHRILYQDLLSTSRTVGSVRYSPCPILWAIS